MLEVGAPKFQTSLMLLLAQFKLEIHLDYYHYTKNFRFITGFGLVWSDTINFDRTSLFRPRKHRLGFSRFSTIHYKDIIQLDLN